MRIDEKWIRAHLPKELADEPIDCFSGEYLDGLTVMQEGERGGDDVVVYRAKSEEDLRCWQLEQVCRFIKEKDPPARKRWRYTRDHAENGHWRYVERRHYDYNAIEDARLYGFECFLRNLKYGLAPARWEDRVREHVHLMNYWYAVPHWDYDREKLCFIEISDSREHDGGDGVEEPRPGSVIRIIDDNEPERVSEETKESATGEKEQRVGQYSRQDLQYAAEFREGVHREVLAIVRKTHPEITSVVDRHGVEEYFQEHWDYPGKWYTIVAIPYGYRSRQALVDTIVRDTLALRRTNEQGGTNAHDAGAARAEQERQRIRKKIDAKQALVNGQITEKDYDRLCAPQGMRPRKAAAVYRDDRYTLGQKDGEPFDALLAEYPDCVVEYALVKLDAPYLGYESHRAALARACGRLIAAAGWSGDARRATGKRIDTEELFSSRYRDNKLNYRRAFLYPPHENSYTGKDFVRVNAALFPNGADELEAYEWTTDWSDYFDEGHEWWGALCLTVYDKSMDRFAVIMASATD